MGESMKGLKRSHMCTEITEKMIGQTVTVMGWVNKRRDFGQLIFITVRDRTGLIQVVVDEVESSKEIFEKALNVRGEYVVAIKGLVCERKEGKNNSNVNLNMETGKIEIIASEFRILSESETPPFQVADVGVKDDLRLKYRYLDLRRPELQRNLFLRHKTAQSVREFFNNEGFIEVETPMLTKSTPEGARDYLVPSRVHPGNFYALPQSPQIFKQILMISGFDRYYQIVKCFRDEDLRADRQPEFTQIDIELSFVDVDDIIEINERLMQKVFKETIGVDINIPFERMPYAEAMERFGSDKPDLRFGMELLNITNIVENSDFAVFQNAIDMGGSVRGINATGCASFPRRQIDSLVDVAKTHGAKGLAWIVISETGEVKTTLSKFFNSEKIDEIIKAFDGKNGDLILICADKDDVVFDSLGNLRLDVAKKLELTKNTDYRFLWVTEFPLLEWVEEDQRFYAKHHPFTSPMEEDFELLEKDPGKVRAKAYDLVLNGSEIGGGSIRIFQRELQEKMFSVLGFTMEDAQERFGFLLDAFKYGAPPHGGLAFGLDRLSMLLTGCSGIRDVIAFPKVKDASCPMTDAPNVVDAKQLKELGIDIIDLKKE